RRRAGRGVASGTRALRPHSGRAPRFFSGRHLWPGQGWSTGRCAGAAPIGLLIEEQADGKLKYAFSNLPADTSRLPEVRLWRSRWPVELGYQQMKEELGLDRHEGRSWRGFHQHARPVVDALGLAPPATQTTP